MRLRTATPADADALATTVVEGFAAYAAFAPAGWAPPDRLALALGLTMRLARPVLRGWLAEDGDGAPVGHVTYLPASQARAVSDEPGLAHLEQLFVRRAHWGSGAAKLLLDRAVDDARAAGFAHLRLGTPAGHARARRFYEREGWSQSSGPWVEEQLGLELVEYRLDLSEMLRT